MGGEYGAGRLHQVVHCWWHFAQGVGGEVFVLEYVEGCAEHLAAFEASDEGIGVDHCAAGGVDQIERLAHTVDEVGVEVVSGFGGEWYVEGDDVGFLLQLLEAHFLYTFSSTTNGVVFVVGYDAASETLQPGGEGFAHIAVADDADGAVAQLYASVALALPLATAHFGVGTGDVVEECQQDAYGVFAYGVAVAFGRVETLDATRLGVGYIDGLHARSYPTYTSQRGHSVDKWFVDVHFATHYQSVAPLRCQNEAFVVVVGLHPHSYAGRLEPLLKYGVGSVSD